MTDAQDAAVGVSDDATPALGQDGAVPAVDHDEAAPAVEHDEGDLAADYLETLLDICDLDGDIEIEQTPGRTTLIVGEAGDEALAHLSSPDVVAALQDLTRLAVQSHTGEFSRVVLDVAGSRDARSGELRDLVERGIVAIEGGEERFALPAMSSYERKLVHDLVAERGYGSESEGEGRDRHAVIVPT